LHHEERHGFNPYQIWLGISGQV